MRIAIAVAASLLLTASVARADEPAAVQLAPQPKWNLGAGLGYGALSFGTLGVQAPSVDVAIERRLSRETWLALGAVATYDHASGDGVGPETGFGGAGLGIVPGLLSSSNGDNTQTGFALNLGIRQVVNPESVVEVSAFANAFVSYAHGSGHAVVQQQTGFGTDQMATVTEDGSASMLRYGVYGGLAAEHRLTERLAVRAELGLVGTSLSSETGDFKSTPQGGSTTDQKSSTSGIHVGLSPSAELTLRFGF